MKPLIYVLGGIALVSFLPAAVDAGARGNPLYFMVAAGLGLLPAWYQSWIRPCVYRQDVTITPDPLAFNARWVAEGMAAAVQKSLIQTEALQLKLNTVQLADNCWQPYDVYLDVERRKVVVEAGAVLNCAGRPVTNISPRVEESRAEAALSGHIALRDLARIHVTTGAGVLLRLERQGDTRVVTRILIGDRAGRKGRPSREVWIAWALLVVTLWNLIRPYMDGSEAVLDSVRVLAGSVVVPMFYELVMRIRMSLAGERPSAVFTPPG